MGLTKYRLGDFLELYSEKCNIPDLTAWDISGVNSDKEFFEPSRQVGEDTSNYKIVPPNYFACNLMHVGRDRVLPIGLNHTDGIKYVSPAYTIFKIKDAVPLIREYFFLMLKSEERDRYFWFHTDSSVRDGMSWDDFCGLEIELPQLQIQQKYVDIYKSMLANLQSYEQGLVDLKCAFDAMLDQSKHLAAKKSMKDLLYEVDNRNEEGKIQNVQGININKQFMASVANTNGIDLQKYKVVTKGQFAFSGMQTGRDECIRLALFTGNDPIIISPAYSVFESNRDLVLPEFIMMWFSRQETDRRGWFMSDSSIRTNLDLDRFYEMELPLPDMDVQKSLADLYNAYTLRRSIGEKLRAQIKNICPILIKGSIEEARKGA